ncbi:MAG: lipoate--protein ligase [Candidatus Cloacimonetes bacterium]|nr:lipoate--protein ligase [Candidatus Cloacimonadota bacterium]
MLIVKSPESNPYFNIASEEYILENFSEDVFMLYINEPSIIVGRYQNTMSQLNLDYVQKNKIKVVRRLTGGGAVFHDLGNLNFSFICQRQEEEERSFIRYTEPIIRYLKSLNVNAYLEGRNDLLIDGRKFSGNARLVTAEKVLQHGTLLFQARLSDLSQALQASPLKFKDKAVKSIQSRVTNISEHLAKTLSVVDFEKGLVQFITGHYPDSTYYEFSAADMLAINNKVTEKYDTWEWNFGKSPQYNFTKTIRSKGGSLEFNLIVDNGMIRKCELQGDFFACGDIDILERALENCKHEPEQVKKQLEKVPISEILINIDIEDIMEGLF